MNDNTSDDIQKVHGSTPDFKTEFAKQLSELAPELVTDGKIDSKKLKELLDGDEADDSERFGLFWPGKKRAMRAAQEPTTATLKPAKDESKDWDTTQNLFIEGDNLEVLKVLQKHYHNKIKMIYIDPPYNTGKDFVYPDNFKEGLQNYLEFSKQVDEGNKKISTNTEVDGRYHSNWLNMMYPRLKLARNLLTGDGCIFVSIDDNEQPHLKKVLDEIFGENNLVAQLVVASNSSKNNSKLVSVSHEYVLVYARNIDQISQEWKVPKNGVNEFQKRAKQLVERGLSFDAIHNELLELVKYPRFYDFDHYTYADRKGIYQLDNPGGVSNGNTETTIMHPTTNKPCTMPSGGWRYKDSEIKRMIANDELEFGVDETTIPRVKRYLHDYLNQTPKSTLFFDSQSSTKWLKANDIPFDFPKSTELIKHLITVGTNGNDVILDFFSGSGTTAHACFLLNAEDGGKRTNIQVQLPEPTDPKSDAYEKGYTKISDISKTRIRRAGEKIINDYADKLTEREAPLDTGFRVYRLADSNFTKWSSDSATDKDSLQQHLLGLRESSNDAASEEDLLTEVLLKQGISLTAPIAHSDVDGLSVWTVGDNLVCAYLNERQKPTLDQLRSVAANEPAKLIVLEDAFQGDDELKTNLVQICKSQKIELWTV